MTKTQLHDRNRPTRHTITYNQQNLVHLIKPGVNTLVEDNVNGFKGLELIHAKGKPPNWKKKCLFKNKSSCFCIQTVKQ